MSRLLRRMPYWSRDSIANVARWMVPFLICLALSTAGAWLIARTCLK